MHIKRKQYLVIYFCKEYMKINMDEMGENITILCLFSIIIIYKPGSDNVDDIISLLMVL